ncbi:hypothetical protein SLEP1_g51738 [Rubroshorea leprosula]|uniref:CRAL-TRIO domain-containing protein n=1 Tax=Rubroshorea leprosula TaxID=152421 RepID=A0AAV5M476_9ROSI|nr:hypothetical protein SLEP1_g51738 [Rubroshorea leprosula]
MHQGYPTETLIRFLKARDWNVQKAHKMLVECLQWRIQNDIDNILAKPIIPTDLYRAVRDSQLVGLSGYSKEGLPIIAFGVGLSTYDKASVNYYVQSHIQMNEYRDRVVFPAATKKYGKYIGTCLKVLDMTGLKLSALNQINLMTVITTIDDLNYPEKTNTYYIVNAPYVFSACWKVVRPLLQERTKKKIQVLQGCGRDELLKASLFVLMLTIVTVTIKILPEFRRHYGNICQYVWNISSFTFVQGAKVILKITDLPSVIST